MIFSLTTELQRAVCFFGILICSNAFSVRLHSSSLSQHTVRFTSPIFLGLVNSFPDNQDGENQELSDGIIGVPTKNVLGGRLQACCFQPKTGFYRVRAYERRFLTLRYSSLYWVSCLQIVGLFTGKSKA